MAYYNSKLFILFVWSTFVLLMLTTTTSKKHGTRHNDEQNWLNHGGDLYNRRFADKETKINTATASRLRLKWEFYAGNDISATPAIFDGVLYFPSWNGNLYAVRASDGSLVWKKDLQTLTGLRPSGFALNVNRTAARATPTIAARDLLIVGIYGSPVLIAVRRSTGDLVWSTRLTNNIAGVITMSGTYYQGSYYIGTSSLEETLGVDQCCVFRGSFLKLNAATGAILWRTYMLPDNGNRTGEYAGAAIWGSSPSIDARRKRVYIATGNLYSAPLRVRECQERQNNRTAPASPDECVEPENHSNSILALDLDTGKIKWYRQLGGYDVWFFACRDPSVSPNCPPGPNPDADFLEAPMMLTIQGNRKSKRDVVVAVQKSGYTWALDRDDGELVWYTEAGPGGLTGGGFWGAATDEKRVYTNIANSEGKTFTLKPSNKNTTAGGWVAMDPNSGRVLWSTADPSNGTASGPVSVANGVVFGGSTSRRGPVFAMNAQTGQILWSYSTGATVYGGASVSDGCIYIGSGYNVVVGVFRGFTAGPSLFAFCVQ